MNVGPTQATVIIVTHNSAEWIGSVLESLTSDPSRPEQVVVVDNASADGTLDLVRRYEVDVVESHGNSGFAGGCHLGVGAARHEVVVFLGHDTIPEPGWLPPLVGALSGAGIGAAMATIEEADRPGHFNTSGGHLTYFGIAWVSDHDAPIPREDELITTAFPSGAAMAMTRENWDRFGGFRRAFFMYHEDTDLGWRLRLAGLRAVRVPTSRVAHHYDFARSPVKMFYIERNRWLMLASNYRWSTLILLSPALLVVEVGTLVVALRDGWFRQKLRAMAAAVRNRDVIKEGRSAVRETRRVGDGIMLATMDHRLRALTLVKPPPGTVVVDGLLGLWLRLVRPLVRVFDSIR